MLVGDDASGIQLVLPLQQPRPHSRHAISGERVNGVFGVLLLPARAEGDYLLQRIGNAHRGGEGHRSDHIPCGPLIHEEAGRVLS